MVDEQHHRFVLVRRQRDKM
jgi:hypothetical protein